LTQPKVENEPIRNQVFKIQIWAPVLTFVYYN